MSKDEKTLQESSQTSLFTFDRWGIISYTTLEEGTFESKPLEELTDDELAGIVVTHRDCSRDMVCWQYKIRKEYDGGLRAEQGELLPEEVCLELKDTVLRPISRDIAKEFIEKYEWLGMVGAFKFAYGLYFGYKLGVALVFSKTTTWQAEVSICGEKYRDKVILLSRGAAANWAPKNANSYAIAKALQAVERDTPYRIVLAYSDKRAGEVGTIYQALNFLFIGLGATGFDNVPANLVDTTDIRFHTRSLPKELKSARRLKEAGYEVLKVARANKCRYITFVGSRRERKELMSALCWKPLEYPKREDFMKPNWMKKFRAIPKGT